MKKSILLASLFATMLSYASGSLAFKSNYDIKKAVISLNDVKQGQQLSIIDYNGIVLHKEMIAKTGSYNKSFDLSALPNGDYYFELDKDSEIRVLPFKIVLDEVEVLTEKESSLFKPFVRSKENKIYFSRMSMNHRPLEINIYFLNNNEELIFSEKIENKNIVERIYVLDKEQKGLYKVSVLTEGRTFSYVIAL